MSAETLLEAEAALKLGDVFSEVLWRYKLTLNERRLGLVLLQRTFLRRSVSVKLDFAALATELGGRSSDWYECFQRLCDLGVVIWSQGEGVAHPNTDMQALSRERALRSVQGQAAEDVHGALPLAGERFLDEAKVQINREAAISSNSDTLGNPSSFDVRDHVQRFRSALESGTVAEEFPEHPPTDEWRPGDGPPPPLRVTASSTDSASLSFKASASVQEASAKLKLRTAASASRAIAVTPADAWDRLLAIDKAGASAHSDYAQQWQSACATAPDRVLEMIEFAEKHRDLLTRDNPWAFLATMGRSRDWGVLRTARQTTNQR